MGGRRFAVAITCIDGRIQDALQRQLREEYDVDHLDVVTLPGVDLALARDEQARGFASRSVDVSVAAHGSEVVILAGHTDCAGNPVDDDTHAAMVREGAKWLCDRYPGLTVAGVLVDTEAQTMDIVADPQRCPQAPGSQAPGSQAPPAALAEPLA